MRGLLRAIREVAKRSAIGPYIGDFGPQGNNTYQKRVPLDSAGLASARGLLVARSGGAVHCHPQTHAGFRGEIYFGEDEAPADELWQPLSRCQISTPPNGESFKSFRVRLRPQSNAEATAELVLVVDPAPYGSEALEAQPPTPEITAGGSSATRIRALLRSSGAEVDLEAADGGAPGRGLLFGAGLDAGGIGRALRVMANGALSVAGLDTGGAQRELRTTAAAPAASETPGAGVLFAAALGYVFDSAAAEWRRLVGDVGPAGVDVLRVAPTTTAGAAVVRQSATNASAQLLAANARRRACLVKNLDTAETAYLRAGSAAAAASGFPLGPGESMSLTTAEVVNVIRGGAADVPLAVWEEVA